MDDELADLAATREKQARGLTLRLRSHFFLRSKSGDLKSSKPPRQALGNLRRPDIRRPFLLVTANFMYIYDRSNPPFNVSFHCSFEDSAVYISSSFVMFAGPFAMIFYGVQIFKETGSFFWLQCFEYTKQKYKHR